MSTMVSGLSVVTIPPWSLSQSLPTDTTPLHSGEIAALSPGGPGGSRLHYGLGSDATTLDCRYQSALAGLLGICDMTDDDAVRILWLGVNSRRRRRSDWHGSLAVVETCPLAARAAQA